MPKVLIVEDEHVIGKTLRDRFRIPPYSSHWVTTAEEGVQWLGANHADLTMTDLRLPGMSGLELLEVIKADHPEMPVVIITAHGDVHSAVQAMKLGAYEFITKPFDLEALVLIAARAMEQGHLQNVYRREQKVSASASALDRIVGRCAGIQRAKDLVRRIATLGQSIQESPPTVLISGETGTGKDLFARALHHEGPRAAQAFVHVNCAALPEALMESELFGHIKGAFTDAKQSKRGLFELADGGTLFLDEVGSLPPALQAKLLTAIETRRIRPVGAVEEKPIDLQLISACNEDLLKRTQEGTFRQDLYHRLRVLHMELPPLRERGSDLDLLIEHFMEEYGKRFHMPGKRLSAAARAVLASYSWPGNVRELSHWLESAVLLSDEEIRPEHLPEPAGERVASLQVGAGGGVEVDFSKGKVSMERVERAMIERALTFTSGNVSRAAELLDLSRDTLRYRIAKYGLEPGGGSGNGA